VQSKCTPEFWECYGALPAKVQTLARKSFRLWQANPRHPSVRFRPHGNGQWSARIGDHSRALADFDGQTYVWTWIGTHEEYNKF